MLASLNLTDTGRRRVRLMVAVAVALAVLAAVWQLLGVLLPFLVSGVVAYLLLPLVKLADRTPWAKRRPNLNRALIAASSTALVHSRRAGIGGVGHLSAGGRFNHPGRARPRHSFRR